MTADAPEAEWIAAGPRFEAVCRELAAAPAYGLDTEFHRERTYYPHAALLQVAWPGGVVLVDPLEVDLGPLAPVLDGPGTMVAHAAEQDIEVLERACGTAPARVFDVQVAAGFLGFSSPSLGSLSQRLLGRKLPKADRLTDWTRRPLSATQLAYAAADVEHLLALRDLLVDRLEAKGRLAWAEQECEELLERWRRRSDPATAWWRLRDARSLRGQTRAIAQAVAEWREREAMARDLPPRFVLPDMALASIVHRPPGDAGELRRVRGLDGRQVPNRVARGLLEAVERGRNLAPSALLLPPSEELDPVLRPVVALASAWVAQRARELRIDAALLATRADVQALLRGDAEARAADGWRRDLIGDDVLRLADGKVAVAFDGEGGLRLVEAGPPVA